MPTNCIDTVVEARHLDNSLGGVCMVAGVRGQYRQPRHAQSHPVRPIILSLRQLKMWLLFGDRLARKIV
jgi:hypothetical protein